MATKKQIKIPTTLGKNSSYFLHSVCSVGLQVQKTNEKITN